MAAMLSGAIARNMLEDLHVKYIPDPAMTELNQGIRNSVFTALQALRAMRQTPRAREYVDYHLLFIPKYWEAPELLPSYVNSIDPTNQWLAALMRGELAPSISSATDFDKHSAEELADEWADAIGKRYPKVSPDAVAIEHSTFLETGRRAKAWRSQHPKASSPKLAEAVRQIYEKLIARHGRDADGLPIWPQDLNPPSGS